MKKFVLISSILASCLFANEIKSLSDVVVTAQKNKRKCTRSADSYEHF